MKFFRWQGIAGIALVTIVIGGFSVFILDGIIKSTIETQGSEKLGTQVGVGSVSTSFFSQSAELKDLVIANPDNPMENTVEIDRIEVQVDGTRALYKKLIINEMTVAGIRFNTPRKTAAQKITKKSGGKESSGEGNDTKTPEFSLGGKLDFPAPEDILKSEKLETLEQAEAVKRNIKELKAKWETKIDSNLSGDFANQIQQRIRGLKEKTTGGIGGLAGAPAAIQEAQDIKKDIEDRVKLIGNFQKEMQTDLNKTRQMLADLKDLPQKDFQRLKNKYSLDTKGGVKLLGLVMGEKIKEKLQKARYYYNKIKPYLEKKESVDKPLRGKGQFIKFAEAEPYPDFLIKYGKLSAEIMGTTVSGELKDFSDNQKIYSKPATLFFSSQQNDKFDEFELHGKMDRTRDEAEDSTNLGVKSLKLTDMTIGNGISIQNGFANIESHMKVLSEKNLTGKVNVDLASISLSFPDQQNNEITQLISEALSSTDKFNIQANISGTLAKQQIDVKTDLDKIIGQAAKKVLAKKVKAFEGHLKESIFSKTAGPLGDTASSNNEFLDLNKILSGQNSSLNGQLDQLTGNIFPGKKEDGGGSLSPFKGLKLPF